MEIFLNLLHICNLSRLWSVLTSAPLPFACTSTQVLFVTCGNPLVRTISSFHFHPIPSSIERFNSSKFFYQSSDPILVLTKCSLFSSSLIGISAISMNSWFFLVEKNHPFLELLFLFQRRPISKDESVVMDFSLFFFITQRDFLYAQLLKLCAHRNNDRIWNSRSALFVDDSHFGRFFPVFYASSSIGRPQIQSIQINP